MNTTHKYTKKTTVRTQNNQHEYQRRLPTTNANTKRNTKHEHKQLTQNN